MQKVRMAPRWSGLLGSILIGCAFSIAMVTPAQSSVEQMCDLAARQAADQSGVPLRVLKAISRTETGRRRSGVLTPWPWTVNMEGKGKWFETEAAARAFVFRHFRDGARSFDVGCFQINYKWHGQAFASIEQMFDPMANAAYAARFLKSLNDELGSWTQAVRAFHSRTEIHADAYEARFNDIYAMLDPQSLQPQPTRNTLAPPANSFPLLTGAGGSSGLGSLVPLTREPTAGSLFQARAPLAGG